MNWLNLVFAVACAFTSRWNFKLGKEFAAKGNKDAKDARYVLAAMFALGTVFYLIDFVRGVI